ncbi:MAG: transferase [Ruminococcaceae bacterium]|nr:transferase [Oscillospiraceae bacterium]
MKIAKKVLGLLVYNLLAKHFPVSFSPIKIGQKKFRAFCGKMILAKCGKNVNIEKGAVFSSKVQLGDNSGIGINSHIGGTTYIGNDVMMGPECIIYTWNHKFDDVTTTMRGQGFQEEKPVYIGDDVWIGGRVIILPGVHIGSHAIIGAGSVVTKSIPDWAIAAGNPARVKKYRNNTENIKMEKITTGGGGSP